jgi:hypothetical protein
MSKKMRALILPATGDVWGVAVNKRGEGTFEATVFSSHKENRVPLVLEDFHIGFAFDKISKLNLTTIRSFDMFYMVVCGAFRITMRSGM